jgi:hypothetical protein
VLIDCDTCSVRGGACRDCVVTVILKNSVGPVELDEAEQYAVGSLATVGLVPPLRLLPAVTSQNRHIESDASRNYQFGPDRQDLPRKAIAP